MSRMNPLKSDDLKLRWKGFTFAIFLIYLFLVLYVTLMAWNYGASLGPTGPGGRNYNLIPLKSIRQIYVYSPTLEDPIIILAGNIVLFLPFGFLLYILLRQKKAKVSMHIFVAGCLLSIFIEVNQFIFTHRVANIDDVILNTVGTILGVFLAHILFIIKRSLKL